MTTISSSTATSAAALEHTINEAFDAYGSIEGQILKEVKGIQEGFATYEHAIRVDVLDKMDFCDRMRSFDQRWDIDDRRNDLAKIVETYFEGVVNFIGITPSNKGWQTDLERLKRVTSFTVSIIEKLAIMRPMINQEDDDLVPVEEQHVVDILKRFANASKTENEEWVAIQRRRQDQPQRLQPVNSPSTAGQKPATAGPPQCRSTPMPTETILDTPGTPQQMHQEQLPKEQGQHDHTTQLEQPASCLPATCQMEQPASQPLASRLRSAAGAVATLATSAAAAAKDTWSSIKLVKIPRPSSLYRVNQKKEKAEGEMPKGDEEGVDTIATKVSAATRTHPSDPPNVKRKLEWELTPQPEAPRANHQQPMLAESPCQDPPQLRSIIVRDEEELRQRLAAAQKQRKEADEQVQFWQKELEIAKEEREKKLQKEKEKEKEKARKPPGRRKGTKKRAR